MAVWNITPLQLVSYDYDTHLTLLLLIEAFPKHVYSPTLVSVRPESDHMGYSFVTSHMSSTLEVPILSWTEARTASLARDRVRQTTA
jgi:hypothetical protein